MTDINISKITHPVPLTCFLSIYSIFKNRFNIIIRIAILALLVNVYGCGNESDEPNELNHNSYQMTNNVYESNNDGSLKKLKNLHTFFQSNPSLTLKNIIYSEKENLNIESSKITNIQLTLKPQTEKLTLQKELFNFSESLVIDDSSYKVWLDFLDVLQKDPRYFKSQGTVTINNVTYDTVTYKKIPYSLLFYIINQFYFSNKEFTPSFILSNKHSLNEKLAPLYTYILMVNNFNELSRYTESENNFYIKDHNEVNTLVDNFFDSANCYDFNTLTLNKIQKAYETKYQNTYNGKRDATTTHLNDVNKSFDNYLKDPNKNKHATFKAAHFISKSMIYKSYCKQPNETIKSDLNSIVNNIEMELFKDKDVWISQINTELYSKLDTIKYSNYNEPIIARMYSNLFNIYKLELFNRMSLEDVQSFIKYKQHPNTDTDNFLLSKELNNKFVETELTIIEQNGLPVIIDFYSSSPIIPEQVSIINDTLKDLRKNLYTDVINNDYSNSLENIDSHKKGLQISLESSLLIK